MISRRSQETSTQTWSHFAGDTRSLADGGGEGREGNHRALSGAILWLRVRMEDALCSVARNWDGDWLPGTDSQDASRKVAYEQPKPGSANVLSPEEEEFVMADQSLEEACLATRPGAELIQSIADEEVFTIFERKVGGWTHRFCSRFKRCQVTGALEVEQFTEVVAPPPLPQMALKFPLNKELGEAGCLFQSALVLCGLLAGEPNILGNELDKNTHMDKPQIRTTCFMPIPTPRCMSWKLAAAQARLELLPPCWAAPSP